MYSLLTGVFPALTVSLPHPQISEASRSCELTRWSETGGSDPKDPPWPLSTLRLSPCTSQWRRVGQDQSKRRRFYKRVGESFIYLWKSFLDRRSLLFLSLSLSKATKAQTFKKKKSSHPFLYSHTYPNTTHQCVALLWGGETFPGEWCVRGHIHTHCQHNMGIFTCAIYKQRLADGETRPTPSTPVSLLLHGELQQHDY